MALPGWLTIAEALTDDPISFQAVVLTQGDNEWHVLAPAEALPGAEAAAVSSYAFEDGADIQVLDIAYAVLPSSIIIAFADTTAFDTRVFAATIVACTLAWTVAEVWVFARTKVLYVDPEAGS